MKLVKKINTSAALAIDRTGHEIVVMGKGIGFPQMPYKLDDLSKIERTFYDVDPKYLGMIAELSQPIVMVCADIADQAGIELDCSLNPNLPFTLADHIQFAAERLKKGVDLTTPIAYDIRHLYPREAAMADKHLPDMVKGFLTPMLIFVIVVPIGYMLVGPAANLLADGVSFVMNLLYNFNHILSDVVIGGFYQILVVLGVHSVIVLPALMDVMAGTPSPNYASLGVVSFAVLGVTLGILCKTKSKKLKELALPAAVSALFGVTEPATYAIVMPRMKYLVVTCVSSAIACGVGGLFGFAVYTIPGFGIFKIPGYIDPANPVQSLIVASGVMLLATALGFIITYVMFNDAQYGDDKE